MRQEESIQYHQIAQAIGYIRSHFREQPSLEEMALQVHMSPFHFQRIFTEWAGVSPKKFVQYLSVEYAKNVLKIQNLHSSMSLMKQAFPVREDSMICSLILKA
ncbi:MAG: AraC family transcriptional regulator [Saprospiraceae bacterium]